MEWITTFSYRTPPIYLPGSNLCAVLFLIPGILANIYIISNLNRRHYYSVSEVLKQPERGWVTEQSRFRTQTCLILRPMPLWMSWPFTLCPEMAQYLLSGPNRVLKEKKEHWIRSLCLDAPLKWNPGMGSCFNNLQMAHGWIISIFTLFANTTDILCHSWFLFVHFSDMLTLLNIGK